VVRELRHFSKGEFGPYWDLMDSELLELLDEFRELWGEPVTISPARGAIGRTYGNGFHNHRKHGTVKAVDVFPKGMVTRGDFDRAYDALLEAKRRLNIDNIGIGLYPDWQPSPGLHIDVGDRDKASGIASWSGLSRGPNGEQKYFSLEEGRNELDD
jgi:hypothetical protein